jgi:hypothetical protein
MRLPKRDLIATGMVGAAALLYLLWVVGWTLPGLSGTRAIGIVILGLGFTASASAVVPGFDQLLHGNKPYLAITSLLGVVGLVGGVLMLTDANEAALGMVMAVMATLWLISTIHHSLLAQTPPPTTRRYARHAT